MKNQEKGMKENVTTGSVKTLGRGTKVKRGQFRCLGGVQRLKESIGSGHAGSKVTRPVAKERNEVLGERTKSFVSETFS